MRRESGRTFVETLVVLYLVAMGLLVAVPALAYLRQEGRTAAGARQMATTFHALRWQSVSLRRSRGLFFESRADGWVWWRVEDGNGNGLRTAEVRDGTDRVLSGPHRLEASIEQVTLGFPPTGSIPRIPPRGGTLDDLSDPVRFGSSNLVSFSPAGSASSGTLYVTDGKTGLYAVVVYGPTARVRVWRYDARERQWTL